mmetsp:Transcript_111053/g.314294  ORF Transcript_111053/g.314294 Transcript_111053/m.314294 type:complete len:442 (+) Transcript_111053:119-1444(+)
MCRPAASSNPVVLGQACFLGRGLMLLLVSFPDGARVVDAVALQRAHHVGEQLQRDHRHERHQVLVRLGHRDHVLAESFELCNIVVLSDYYGEPAACPDLLDVGPDLVVGGVRPRGDEHHRHELVDEGDGPVLHLRRRVALGVDVRELLHLHRALEGHREVEAASEEDEVGREHVLAADVPEHALPDLERPPLRLLLAERQRLPVEHGQDVVRELHQLLHDHLPLRAHEGAARVAQVDGEQHQGQHGGGEGLRGGDAQLLAGHDVYRRVALAGEGGAVLVDEGQRQDLAAVRRALQGPQALDRVGGLARVRDDDEGVARAQEGQPVPELRRVLHLHRYPGDVLDEVLRQQGRVPRAAATDDHDLVLEIGPPPLRAGRHDVDRPGARELVRWRQRRPQGREVDLPGTASLEVRLQHGPAHLRRLPDVLEDALLPRDDAPVVSL